MPDPPNYHKRPHPGKRVRRARTTGSFQHTRSPHRRYAELRCKSNFSFLRGASHPEELAGRAAELGYDALAITDRNTLAGVVRMHEAAKASGIKLIIGAELTPVDAPPILLYATDRASYGRLARIITQGRLRAAKGSCSITLADIDQWNHGLIAAVPLDGLIASHHSDTTIKTSTTRTINGETAHPAFIKSDRHRFSHGSQSNMPSDVLDYLDMFADRLFWSVSIHDGSSDLAYLARANAFARASGVPLLATNDVHYHEPRRRFLQDVVTCIREHCTVVSAGRRLFANAERHLKSIDELERLFAGCPDAVARTVELADRCTFTLDGLRYEYPEALCPPGRSPTKYLAELTRRGARERYPRGIPHKVRKLIEHELVLIRKLSYEPYFLTVWDIVRYARSRGILCQGRGSAANSAVCYCLGITAVDPDRIDTLFERFLSTQRNEPPDIDVDFEHARREEVFQYIYEKYGRAHAGLVAEVITYRSRSAIRDVGRALGLSLDRIAALAKKHDWWDRWHDPPPQLLREAGFDPNDRTLRLLGKLVRQLVGFPRHLSQHVGGFVITRGPLCEMVPLENGAMPGRTFIEWDKDDIDALGILKIDCLALGMLTAIHKCLTLLPVSRDHQAIVVTHAPGNPGLSAASPPAVPCALHEVPSEDPAVYDMICQADTVGVFQIESRAQMSMLPRLKPRTFYDLVIEVAIVRPGPIQGDMVHPYLRRRCGEEAVTYPNDSIKGVLERTLGVPLFQEQAMKLAVVAAGFTPGEADQLRRAMAAWRRNGSIDRFRAGLIDGMTANGLSRAFAERCFQQMCGFGEYGFPESHAASFALLVYVSAWLKRYYPAAFCASIINAQPMGFYQPAQLVRDARAHGVTVRAVDVNHSGYDCGLEMQERDKGDRGEQIQDPENETRPEQRKGNREAVRRHPKRTVVPRGSVRAPRRSRISDPSQWGVGGPALRLGMRLVRGVSRAQVEGIERAQGNRPFTSVVDVARRSGATRATLARLAAADAFGSIGLNRRDALWRVLALDDDPPILADYEHVEPQAELPIHSLEQTVMQDYATTGLSLNAHPLSLIRGELRRLRIRQTRVLSHARHGQSLSVAGLVLVRQRPSTAKGILFCTIEDETGSANLIIRPSVYEKCRRVARGAAVLVAHGRVERKGEVVHLQALRLEDASAALTQLKSRSRNFH